jgi:hypothetical protein
MGRQFGDVCQRAQGQPIVGWIQQQNGEQRTGGRPEHSHTLRSDQQGEPDANGKEVQREIHGPGLERT